MALPPVDFQQFVQFVRQIGGAPWRTDVAARFTYVDPSLQWITGQAVADTVGAPVVARMGSEDAASLQGRLALAAATGVATAVCVNIRQRHLNGDWIWTELTATSQFEGGVFTGFWGMTRVSVERTESLPIRTVVDGSEAEAVAALLDSSPDFIWFKDRDSRFVRVSRALGYKIVQQSPRLRDHYLRNSDVDVAKLVYGATDLDLFDPVSARREQDEDQEVIGTSQPVVNKEARQILADGTEMWVLTHRMPWRNRDGAVIGTFGMARDVTEAKRAAQDLARVNQQLMVASRFEGMAEVASGVLHNVGNALNTAGVALDLIRTWVAGPRLSQLHRTMEALDQRSGGLTDFLQSDYNPEKFAAYLRALSQAMVGERREMLNEIETLRHSISNIAEIVSTQQYYATRIGITERVLVREVVEDAIRIHASALGRYRIRVQREYRANPCVRVDRHKVLQVLVNLIQNAKRACDQGRSTDRLIAVSIAERERRAMISVVDNGCGIAADSLEAIFHGDNSRDVPPRSGLHQAALTARQLGGALAARSDGVEAGATFTLELPVAR